MITTPDNDNKLDSPMVFIILGKGYESKESEGIELHILLTAPDDDTAVREALNALSEEGFIEADLDQIGVLTEEPVEEPHASAYQGALEGEVSIIRFG
ncbi:transcriptional regulator [Rhizobium oryzicola]|uniref:Transcriptional regulator n=1 Tax=Rhizobium oryzicola TaxID=1232668 RepID=A0ABT8T541_9HYPH|nr:transcriptional regulator [Rhizobium oryzicola]MDO1585655.1 transcriptional regulator [Rhizobium oryzicola]